MRQSTEAKRLPSKSHCLNCSNWRKWQNYPARSACCIKHGTPTLCNFLVCGDLWLDVLDGGVDGLVGLHRPMFSERASKSRDFGGMVPTNFERLDGIN